MTKGISLVSFNDKIVERDNNIKNLEVGVEELQKINQQLLQEYVDTTPPDVVLDSAKGKLTNLVLIGEDQETGGVYLAASNASSRINLHMLTLARLIFERSLFSQFDQDDHEED